MSKGEKNTSISVFDLPRWYEARLIEKYAHALQPVLRRLKPALILLKSTRVCIHEIRELIIADHKAETLSSLLIQVDSVVPLLHSLIIGFPTCIDYDFIVHFIKSNSDVMSILMSNVRALEKALPSYSGFLKEKLPVHLRKLQTLIQLHHIQISLLDQEVGHAALVLSRLTYLNNIVRIPMHQFMDDLDMLQTQEHIIEQYTSTYIKNQNAALRYSEFPHDELLLKAHSAIENNEQTITKMNTILDPFLTHMGNYTRARKSAPDTNDDEHSEYFSYLFSLQFPAGFSETTNSTLLNPLQVGERDEDVWLPFHQFYESVGSAEDFFRAVDVLPAILENTTISKKKKTALIDFAHTFDRHYFAACYVEYTAEMLYLHKIETDPIYIQRLQFYKDAANEVAATQKTIRKIRDEYQQWIDVYKRWLCTGKELQDIVYGCCLAEFNMHVEVLLPQMQHTSST